MQFKMSYSECEIAFGQPALRPSQTANEATSAVLCRCSPPSGLSKRLRFCEHGTACSQIRPTHKQCSRIVRDSVRLSFQMKRSTDILVSRES
jgi:hypothetical protein